jgi:hypothetical protein
MFTVPGISNLRTPALTNTIPFKAHKSSDYQQWHIMLQAATKKFIKTKRK